MSMLGKNWDDLPSRLASASILFLISATCIYLGGEFFKFFIILLVGIMHWELGKMLTPTSKQAFWFSAYLSSAVTFYLISSESNLWSTLFLAVNFYFQRYFFHHNKNFGAFYSLALIICGYIFYDVRINFGLYHATWLIGIVVLTDIAGYLIGRLIGGPKILPRISPNKTWSGVLGGWLAAGIFAWLFVHNVVPQNLFINFIVFSIVLSVAAQVGDLAQSHLKRISKVKDSSNLLPGHGGFMDRFDGFIGATVVIGLFFEWVI